MALESATYIHQLNQSNPVGATDPKSQGDDHLRLLKTTLQNTLPNVEGEVLTTHTELNILNGATLSTAELNILDGVTVTAATINKLGRSAGAVDDAGYLGIPNNDQAGNYNIVATDDGKMIRHGSADGSGDAYTIQANATLALPIGFAFSVVNLSSATVAINIATDTLRWGGTAGNRTLSQYGIATVVKVDTTLWLITGSGLA